MCFFSGACSIETLREDVLAFQAVQVVDPNGCGVLKVVLSTGTPAHGFAVTHDTTYQLSCRSIKFVSTHCLSVVHEQTVSFLSVLLVFVHEVEVAGVS